MPVRCRQKGKKKRSVSDRTDNRSREEFTLKYFSACHLPHIYSVPTKLNGLIDTKHVEKYNVILSSAESLYDKIDTLLLMSVKAGYGGQKFLNSTYNRLEEINSIRNNYQFKLEIDGGVDKEIYQKLKSYNIDIYVVGSYVCANENFIRPIKELLK